MAKKPPKTRRNHIIQFRCNDAEHAEILRRADRAGYPPGTFARACALGSPGPRAHRIPPTNKIELVRLHHEINKVGNNLNQAQKSVNMGRLPPLAELKAACKDISDFRIWVRRALNMADDSDGLAGAGQ